MSKEMTREELNKVNHLLSVKDGIALIINGINSKGKSIKCGLEDDYQENWGYNAEDVMELRRKQLFFNDALPEIVTELTDILKEKLQSKLNEIDEELSEYLTLD